MFEFTSLVPPEQLDNARIRASLFNFQNDIRVLADPGWDTVSDLTHIESVLNSIDLILLSHASMPFIGAFAYLYKKNPGAMRSIPVYTTAPVANLGKIETMESYRVSGLVGPVVDYQLEMADIEEAFDSVTLIKHNQSTIFKGKQDSITITAINAGHSLGGIIWLFNKSSEKIIYAPAWNHSKDSYLEGAKILQENGNPVPLLSRPSVMITSAMIGSSLSYNKRVEKFLNMVDATLQNSGTVLLPISLGSRLLELVHLIDDHLRFMPYQVYLLARTGTKSLTQAGSMLEWMSPTVTKEWHTRGKSPYAASTVTIIDHHELEKLQGSKVVFCCGEGLESGSPAFESFTRLCNDPTTTVLLTERAEKGTLAHELYQYWEAAAAERNNGKIEDGIAVPYQSTLHLERIEEEYLVGAQLEQYMEAVKARRQQDKENKVKLEKQQKKEAAAETGTNNENLLKIDGKKILAEDDDDEDEDDEDEANGDDESQKRAKRARKQTKEKEENLKENLPLDIDVRNSKGKNRMFPYIPKKLKYDDYGEVINPADFAKKDSKYDFRHGKGLDNKIGEKRKFGQDSLSSKKNALKQKKDKTNKTDELIALDALREPRRQVSKNLSIYTKCGLVFVDLAGLVDLRSLSLIIPSLKPRKLLLLSDMTSDVNTANVFKQLTSISRRRRPNGYESSKSNNLQKLFDVVEVKNNQEVEIDDSVAALEILLDDSIMEHLKWQKISGGFSIAQVIGTVVNVEEIEENDAKASVVDTATSDKEGDVKMIKEGEENEEEKDVTSDNKEAESKTKDLVINNGMGLKAISEASSQLMNIRHTPLAIGDIRLKELKDFYSTFNEVGVNHTAEFKGEGTLVIDNKICIRKISEGDFVVEGSACTLFYEVREKVRNMLAYV
ncbi:cleavage polyadenylation factor subunit [Saccharomycopsis crataegensis]|uniref:Cleavage and polyadenylation specificity factor subunit 2 n=1 Tax=Saccharomycopsis crataegensis TaxID=43959 RepID=A0AAV5QEF3_9ASCO|nr:cleavage polyadenylation factor subunit [Saccharomycopsis crataegensis]